MFTSVQKIILAGHSKLDGDMSILMDQDFWEKLDFQIFLGNFHTWQTKMKNFELTEWQKVQATLLYDFSSIERLKVLQNKLNLMINGIEGDLNSAKIENRDIGLISTQWGVRDTSENWANNAWPHLKDLQVMTSRQIADRASEIYRITGVNSCARAIAEYSTAWQTQDEYDKNVKSFEDIQEYSSNINLTLDKSFISYRWNDALFAAASKSLSRDKLPKFVVSSSIVGRHNEIPPRTGVYVLKEDPHASLQFAWSGEKYGKIIAASSFNSLGLAALKDVGRSELWINTDKMYRFALANKENKLIKVDHLYSESMTPALASELVSRTAFCITKGDWYYVELVSGEFEKISNETTSHLPMQIRAKGGEQCPESGFYFTPAKVNSRRFFTVGETMPIFSSESWVTIWQKCDD